MLNGFLLIGQSNMAGRGQVSQLPSPVLGEGILMFREGRWMPASEPLHTDKPEIAGVGPGSGFALALRERFPDREIGLIPCAMGGSALDEWKRGLPLYEKAVEAVKSALAAPRPGKLKGVLWHQGEADCNDPALLASYAQRFMTLYHSLTGDLGLDPSLPWILGELGSYLQQLYGSDGWQKLNRVFHEIAGNAGPSNMAVASSEGCVDLGDGLHFDTASQQLLGRRYGERWLECGRRAGISLE